jgi:hypothetical protein
MATKEKSTGISCRFVLQEPKTGLDRFKEANGDFSPYAVAPVGKKSGEYVTASKKTGYSHVEEDTGKKHAWHPNLLSVAVGEGKIQAVNAQGKPAKIGEVVVNITVPEKMGRDSEGHMLV